MTLGELKSLLLVRTETRNLDFKEKFNWFMSNVAADCERRASGEPKASIRTERMAWSQRGRDRLDVLDDTEQGLPTRTLRMVIG